MTPAIPPLRTPLPASHPAHIASAPIAFAPTIAPHTAQSMTQPPPPSEATQASWAAWASDEPGLEAGAEDHWMNRWFRTPDKNGVARKPTAGAINIEKTGQQQDHPARDRQVSAPGSGVKHGGAVGGALQLPRMPHGTIAVASAGAGRWVNGVWVAANAQQPGLRANLPQTSHSSGRARAPPHPPAAPQPPQPPQPPPAPPVWGAQQPNSPKHDRPRERLARAEPTPENAFVRTARQWRAFAVAWTALVDDLRQSDLLSDGETAHLRLVDTSGVKSWAISACAFGSQGQRIPEAGVAGSVAPYIMDPQAVGNELETCLGPVLLPGLVHAGLVQRLIDGGGSGAGTRQATLSLSQLRGVTLSLLLGLGLVLPEEVPVLKEMGSYWEARPVSAQHQHEREELLSAAQHFSLQLMQWCPGHVSVESPQPRELLRYAKIVVKALILEVQKAHSSAWWSSTKATLKGQLAVLEAMQARLAGMQDAALRQCLARLRLVAPAALSQEGPMRGGGSSFCPGGLFRCNDHVSAATFGEVLVGSLVALLSLQPSEALPRNKDARSALATFLNSLAMNSLKEPASLAATPSLVTLTPLYHEDVLYPLDAHALAAELSDMRRLKFPSEAERQATLAKWAAELPDLVSADRPEGDASVSIIDYLKSIHGDEFMNFTERVARQAGLGPADAARITEHDFAAGGALHAWAVELQLWASYRSQVASRTVKGMECYQRALRVLASIEHPVSPAPDARAEAEAERDRWLEKLMETKYYHVLTAQEYGKQRASPRLKDAWNARSMELLLARHHSALRIAFVAGNEQLGQASYSVLLRARPQPSTPAAGGAHNSLVPHSVLLEERYRVRMPANPYTKRGVILGEGKPENQNHAVIFCLGEAVQVIDMNQDNRLSEALKMRSVLQELQLAGDYQLYSLLEGLVKGVLDIKLRHALLKLAHHRARTPPVSMVGMKEWIFSNRSGALGAFAACTEYAFSSVIQRCMTGGGVRLHYGHPDVFNRQQVMTRGGLSKATRTLHVSEDVFSGMGHLLRGGKNVFVEHSSVGKGRDMGFASILGFESKISAGNAQVFLSREMARLTSRLDIFRLLHFYHSGLGYFTTALLTMAALKLQVLCLVVIPLAGVAMLPQPDGSRIATVSGASFAILAGKNRPAAHMLISAWLLSLLLTDLHDGGYLKAGRKPAVFNVHGCRANSKPAVGGSEPAGCWIIGHCDYLGQAVPRGQHGLLWLQVMQTTAWHFFSGVTYPGSAAYVATGRGFALLPVSFNTLYGQYGRSHLLPGAELAALLCSAGILLAQAGFSLAGIAALTWPLWMQCFCMLFAPFWFSPQAFQWDKVHQDWGAWRRWVLGREPDPVMGSWSTWNRNTLASTRNWQGQHTGMLGTAVLGLIVDAGPPALLAGMAAVRLLLLQPYAAAMLGGTLLLWLVLGFMAAMRAFRLHDGKERSWQRAKVVCIFLMVVVCIAHIVAMAIWLKTTGLSPVLTTLLLHVCLILTAHRFALHMLPALRWAWLVDGGFWLEDAAVGGVLLSVVSLLTLGGLVTKVQQVLLTNLKYARCVREGRLTHAMLKNNKGGLTKLARPAGGPGGRGPGGTGPSGPGAVSTTVSRAGGGSSVPLSGRATRLVNPADEALSATAALLHEPDSAVALGRQRLDVEASRLSTPVSTSHTSRPSATSTQQATARATGATGDVEDSPPYIPAYDDSDNELHEDLAAEMDAAIEEAERGARRAETMKPVGSLAKMLTMKRGSLRSIMWGAAEPAAVAPGRDAEESAAATTTATNKDKTVDWLRSRLNADWGTRDAQQEVQEGQPLALPGSLAENSSSRLGTLGRRSRPHALSRIVASLGQLGATLPRASQPASPATQRTSGTVADMQLALPPAGQGWTSGLVMTLSGAHSNLIRRSSGAHSPRSRAAEGAENGELMHTSSFLRTVAASVSRLGSASARQNASTSQTDPAPSVQHSRPTAEATEIDNSPSVMFVRQGGPGSAVHRNRLFGDSAAHLPQP
ncbi:hypothetical protein QJQ45_028726 [Haematococcus lacustris]|nr:hypothetical protein QJQ45_028726 [Haematococcus lacustris]